MESCPERRNVGGRWCRWSTPAAAIALVLGGFAWQPTMAAAQATEYRALLGRYCVTCHNQALVDGESGRSTPLTSQLRAVGLALDSLDLETLSTDAAHWEAVVRKLRAGLMPPAGRPRPDEATLDGFRAWLESGLDAAATARPDPGRTATFHRLNRAEYRNAIRDLLALEIPVDDFLPADDASFGFDNIGGVLRMSQSLLERYLEASRTISRLAVGSPPPAPFSETYRAAQDEQQHERATGLPFGTRGGMLVSQQIPLDADYDLTIQLSGTRGLSEEHPLEITVDGARLELITLGPAGDGSESVYFSGSTIERRVSIDAGPRAVQVARFRSCRASPSRGRSMRVGQEPRRVETGSSAVSLPRRPKKPGARERFCRRSRDAPIAVPWRKRTSRCCSSFTRWGVRVEAISRMASSSPSGASS